MFYGELHSNIRYPALGGGSPLVVHYKTSQGFFNNSGLLLKAGRPDFSIKTGIGQGKI